jgi:hypothetical protein
MASRSIRSILGWEPVCPCQTPADCSQEGVVCGRFFSVEVSSDMGGAGLNHRRIRIWTASTTFVNDSKH